MAYTKDQLKAYAENKTPVKEYLDLLSEDDKILVVNLPYTPKPFFSKSIMRKLKRRLFWLRIKKFFGDKRVK